MTNTDTRNDTPTSSNRAVVRRFVDDVLNHGRLGALAEIVHPDYRYIGPDGARLEGLDGLQMLVAGYRAGFSDFHVAVTSELAEGDLVAMTMMLTGTHDGEFDGIPATGERLRLPLAVVTRIEDGRIIEDREFYDTATLLAQLGLPPTSSPSM